MGDVQFDEEHTDIRRSVLVKKSSGFRDLVLKTGMVKTEKEADYILLGIAICAVIIAGFLFISTFGSAPLPPAPVSGG
jgi:hypothetical protein